MEYNIMKNDSSAVKKEINKSSNQARSPKLLPGTNPGFKNGDDLTPNKAVVGYPQISDPFSKFKKGGVPKKRSCSSIQEAVDGNIGPQLDEDILFKNQSTIRSCNVDYSQKDQAKLDESEKSLNDFLLNENLKNRTNTNFKNNSDDEKDNSILTENQSPVKMPKLPSACRSSIVIGKNRLSVIKDHVNQTQSKSKKVTFAPDEGNHKTTLKSNQKQGENIDKFANKYHQRYSIDIEKVLENYEDYRYNDVEPPKGTRERSGTLMGNFTSVVETKILFHDRKDVISNLGKLSTIMLKKNLPDKKALPKDIKENKSIISGQLEKGMLICNFDLSQYTTMRQTLIILSKRPHSYVDDRIFGRGERSGKGGVIDLKNDGKSTKKYEVKNLAVSARNILKINTNPKKHTTKDRQNAAKTIQTAWKAMKARYNRLNEKIIKIQAAYKGFLVRNYVNSVMYMKYLLESFINHIRAALLMYINRNSFSLLVDRFGQMYRARRYLEKVMLLQRNFKEYLTYIKNPNVKLFMVLNKIIQNKKRDVFDSIFDYGQILKLRSKQYRGFKDKFDPNPFHQALRNHFGKSQLEKGFTEIESQFNASLCKGPFSRLKRNYELGLFKDKVVKISNRIENISLKKALQKWRNQTNLDKVKQLYANTTKLSNVVKSSVKSILSRRLNKYFNLWRTQVVIEDKALSTKQLKDATNKSAGLQKLLKCIQPASRRVVCQSNFPFLISEMKKQAQTCAVNQILRAGHRQGKKIVTINNSNSLLCKLGLRRAFRHWRNTNTKDKEQERKTKNLLEVIEKLRNMKLLNAKHYLMNSLLLNTLKDRDKLLKLKEKESTNKSGVVKLCDTIKKVVVKKHFKCMFSNFSTSNINKRSRIQALKNTSIIKLIRLCKDDNKILRQDFPLKSFNILKYFHKWRLTVFKLLTEENRIKGAFTSLCNMAKSKLSGYFNLLTKTLYFRGQEKQSIGKYITKSNQLAESLSSIFSKHLPRNDFIDKLNSMQPLKSSVCFRKKLTKAFHITEEKRNVKLKRYFEKWKKIISRVQEIQKSRAQVASFINRKLRSGNEKLRRMRLTKYFNIWKSTASQKKQTSFEQALTKISQVKKQEDSKSIALGFKKILSKSIARAKSAEEIMKALQKVQDNTKKYSLNKMKNAINKQSITSIKAKLLSKSIKRIEDGKDLLKLQKRFKFWSSLTNNLKREDQNAALANCMNEEKLLSQEEYEIRSKLNKHKRDSQLYFDNLEASVADIDSQIPLAEEIFFTHFVKLFLGKNFASSTKAGNREELPQFFNEEDDASRKPSDQIMFNDNEMTNDDCAALEPEISQVDPVVTSTPPLGDEQDFIKKLKKRAQAESIRNALKLKFNYMKLNFLSPYFRRWHSKAMKSISNDASLNLKRKILANSCNALAQAQSKRRLKSAFEKWKANSNLLLRKEERLNLISQLSKAKLKRCCFINLIRRFNLWKKLKNVRLNTLNQAPGLVKLIKNAFNKKTLKDLNNYSQKVAKQRISVYHVVGTLSKISESINRALKKRALNSFIELNQNLSFDKLKQKKLQKAINLAETKRVFMLKKLIRDHFLKWKTVSGNKIPLAAVQNIIKGSENILKKVLLKNLCRPALEKIRDWGTKRKAAALIGNWLSQAFGSGKSNPSDCSVTKNLMQETFDMLSSKSKRRIESLRILGGLFCDYWANSDLNIIKQLSNADMLQNVYFSFANSITKPITTISNRPSLTTRQLQVFSPSHPIVFYYLHSFKKNQLELKSEVDSRKSEAGSKLNNLTFKNLRASKARKKTINLKKIISKFTTSFAYDRLKQKFRQYAAQAKLTEINDKVSGIQQFWRAKTLRKMLKWTNNREVKMINALQHPILGMPFQKLKLASRYICIFKVLYPLISYQLRERQMALQNPKTFVAWREKIEKLKNANASKIQLYYLSKKRKAMLIKNKKINKALLKSFKRSNFKRSQICRGFLYKWKKQSVLRLINESVVGLQSAFRSRSLKSKLNHFKVKMMTQHIFRRMLIRYACTVFEKVSYYYWSIMKGITQNCHKSFQVEEAANARPNSNADNKLRLLDRTHAMVSIQILPLMIANSNLTLKHSKMSILEKLIKSKEKKINALLKKTFKKFGTIDERLSEKAEIIQRNLRSHAARKKVNNMKVKSQRIESCILQLYNKELLLVATFFKRWCSLKSARFFHDQSNIIKSYIRERLPYKKWKTLKSAVDKLALKIVYKKLNLAPKVYKLKQSIVKAFMYGKRSPKDKVSAKIAKEQMSPSKRSSVPTSKRNSQLEETMMNNLSEISPSEKLFIGMKKANEKSNKEKGANKLCKLFALHLLTLKKQFISNLRDHIDGKSSYNNDQAKRIQDNFRSHKAKQKANQIRECNSRIAKIIHKLCQSDDTQLSLYFQIWRSHATYLTLNSKANTISKYIKKLRKRKITKAYLEVKYLPIIHGTQDLDNILNKKIPFNRIKNSRNSSRFEEGIDKMNEFYHKRLAYCMNKLKNMRVCEINKEEESAAKIQKAFRSKNLRREPMKQIKQNKVLQTLITKFKMSSERLNLAGYFVYWKSASASIDFISKANKIRQFLRRRKLKILIKKSAKSELLRDIFLKERNKHINDLSSFAKDARMLKSVQKSQNVLKLIAAKKVLIPLIIKKSKLQENQNQLAKLFNSYPSRVLLDAAKAHNLSKAKDKFILKFLLEIRKIKSYNAQQIIKKWRLYCLLKRMSKKKLTSLNENVTTFVIGSTGQYIKESGNTNFLSKRATKIENEIKIINDHFKPPSLGRTKQSNESKEMISKKGYKNFINKGKDTASKQYNVFADSDEDQ